MKIKLICIPFAGGSSYSFQNMVPYLGPEIDLTTVELPGRGKRIAEELIDRTPLLVEDIFQSIKPTVFSGEAYALFGHSMGGLLGYLLLHKIKAEGGRMPVHFFCSGANAPSFVDDEKQGETPTHLLSKEEFIEKLRTLGGTTPEILEHEGLMELYEPILRSDFKIVELYDHELLPPLDVPMSVWIGTEDKVKKESALKWKEAAQDVEVKLFPGGHFFIFDHLKELTDLMKEKLNDQSIS